MENKIHKLSSNIVDYSIKVKKNEKVLITYNSANCHRLVKYLIKDIIKKEGIPMVKLIDSEINRLLLETTSEERIELLKKQSHFEVINYDSFINIRYAHNDFENKDIDSKIDQKIGLANRENDDIRINQRKWVLLNYPSNLDAHKAKMSTEKYYNYALDVMNIDYKEMNKLIKPLKDIMEKTDKVRIIGPNTDLIFSIRNMPIIPCVGESNLPDGELYTAPIKESVNGIITYNTPCPYKGYVFTGVSLQFKDGKIVSCRCDSNQELLEKIFNTDEGSSYIGEFALGLNPKITHPMGDILYDEKIIGSLHFTPGRAYRNADNGNVSSIHWDMVLVQTTHCGGGEIYFDDVLIRKDGIFVLPELRKLNYDLK